MPEQGEPFAASQHGCGGYQTTWTTQPTHCRQPVRWAGVYYYPADSALWHAFACDDHRHQMQAVRPVEPRDLEELTARGRAWRRAQAGGPWVPPAPLATGAAATGLLARAVAYYRQETTDDEPAARAAPPPRRRVRRQAERAARRGRART